jgi:hypothetical protein
VFDVGSSLILEKEKMINLHHQRSTEIW